MIFKKARTAIDHEYEEVKEGRYRWETHPY